MPKKDVELADARILIVDDAPLNLDTLRTQLEEAGYEALVSKSGTDALRLVGEVVPDLILLDVMMPGIDGFETCRLLQSNTATQDIPVIFLTALEDTENVIKGFAAGGADYVANLNNS